jgi:hypothetical protein
VLARSAHLGLNELTVVLDVIADRILLPTPAPLTSGEPDRLALATMTILRRGLVPMRIMEPWLARLTAGATETGAAGEDPYATTANPEAFLRAFHLQVALAAEPVSIRADLLLELVDALRSTNAAYLRSRT